MAGRVKCEWRPHADPLAGTMRVIDNRELLHGDLSCHSYTYCAPEHHHHLVCTSCGEITSVTAGPVERELRNVARQANFRPETHHIEIYGQCQTCQLRA